MPMPTRLQWRDELYAIISTGQGSVLFLKGKQVEVEDLSPAVIVNQIAQQLGINLRSIRSHVRRLLGRQMVPLPLEKDFTLVPLRVREGAGAHWGYVVHERAVFYQRIQEPPLLTGVYLEDGAMVKTLFTPGTLRRIWRETAIAKREAGRYFSTARPAIV